MAYFAYGLAFASDLPLGLPTVDRPAELVIEGLEHPVDRTTVEWFDTDPGGWCDAGRVGDDYYLSFGGEAEFLVSTDGSIIRWLSFVERSPTLTHLLLDHVLPRALTRRRKAVMHGSCLSQSPGTCYAILGDSGRGKSTLAAALTARGHRFLADDGVVVEVGDDGPYAVAAYPELRLGADSVQAVGLGRLTESGMVTRAGTKRRMALADQTPALDERYRLDNVFVLHEVGVERPRLEGPFGPARSTIELLSHSFHLNRTSDRAESLDRFTAIAESCEVRSLAYEHTPAGLARAVADIEGVLSPAADAR